MPPQTGPETPHRDSQESRGRAVEGQEEAGKKAGVTNGT